MVAFHNYCWTMDHKYFDVIFDYFMSNFKKYWKDEVDMLYILDSTWGVDVNALGPNVQVIKVPESLRYYDAYKRVLPDIKEDLVMFMDNDMVVYKEGIVDHTFKKLEEGYDVVSIYDTCGKHRFYELGMQNKFCPYWFATKKDLLMNYTGCEWGPEMPEFETLGRLTFKMLTDGLKPFEIEEDKTPEGKDLGYYHIRAGSVPAYLLTTKHFGNPNTYWDYINNQPSSEILRQCNWYDLMGGDTSEIRKDISEKETVAVNR